MVSMNKDALLATFIGFIVGLIVTGLVLYGPGFAKNFPKIQFPKLSFSLPSFGKGKTTPTPTPQLTQTSKEHAVIIESPLTDALEQSDKVLVSGTTSTSSTVVISGPVDEIVIEANGDGKYAGKVSLSEGKNDITVFSFQKSGAVAQATVSVFYTPEEW